MIGSQIPIRLTTRSDDAGCQLVLLYCFCLAAELDDALVQTGPPRFATADQLVWRFELVGRWSHPTGDDQKEVSYLQFAQVAAQSASAPIGTGKQVPDEFVNYWVSRGKELERFVTVLRLTLFDSVIPRLFDIAPAWFCGDRELEKAEVVSDATRVLRRAPCTARRGAQFRRTAAYPVIHEGPRRTSFSSRTRRRRAGWRDRSVVFHVERDLMSAPSVRCC